MTDPSRYLNGLVDLGFQSFLIVVVGHVALLLNWNSASTNPFVVTAPMEGIRCLNRRRRSYTIVDNGLVVYPTDQGS